MVDQVLELVSAGYQEGRGRGVEEGVGEGSEMQNKEKKYEFQIFFPQYMRFLHDIRI